MTRDLRSAAPDPAPSTRDSGSSPSRKIRVAVLMGGPSPERDVSLGSGEQVVASLDPARYDVLPVEITRDGQWLPRPELLRLAASPSVPRIGGDGSAHAGGEGPATSGRNVPARVSGHMDDVVGNGQVDVAFIALHGPYGEDGTVQGLLELLGVPYTGSGVLASALAMDKLRSRQILQANGIPVPAYAVVDGGAWPGNRDRIAAQVARELEYPCVVKPNAVGSSFGVSLVHDQAGLPEAIERALEYGDVVLVEEFLDGTELTCGILEDPATGVPHALPIIEIVPKRAFFDYAAKYEGESEEICPARISAAAARKAQQIAVRVHAILGCEGFSRVDLFLVDGNIVVLEANTIPGLTAGSLIPKAARAAGIEFPDLVGRVIQSALRRSRRKRRGAGG